MNPRIAVLVPTKNRKELLTRALESLFTQKIAPDEIIVVDDGSTDGTKEFLSALVEEGKPISVIYKEKSGGVNAARNAGIKYSNAEWVAFLDDDDIFVPEAVSRIKGKISEIPKTYNGIFFNTLIHTKQETFAGGFQFEGAQEYYDPTYENTMVKYGLRGDCKPVIRKQICTEEGYWFPESVNGFESFFFCLLARDKKGIRYYKDISTEIFQQSDDRLSVTASKKKPFPLMKLHLQQIFQHFSFYIRHPVLLFKKKIEIGKLLLRSFF